jgi:hypothetical protein
MRSGLVAPVAVVFLAMLVPAGAAAPSSRDFQLITLTQLGTITWRCDAPDGARQALGFAAYRRGATETVQFSATGAATTKRLVQPGQTLRFPALRYRTQHLEIVQGTKVGTLHASVSTHFVAGRNYCFSYWPPSTDVRFVRS